MDHNTSQIQIVITVNLIDLPLFRPAVFEEPEDPTNRSFFSEIISSISDVKFSHNGRYMIARDYLSVKVWDLQMDTKPIETYQVHEYLRSKLCALYENDCIFDKFECSWSGNDRYGYDSVFLGDGRGLVFTDLVEFLYLFLAVSFSFPPLSVPLSSFHLPHPPPPFRLFLPFSFPLSLFSPPPPAL